MKAVIVDAFGEAPEMSVRDVAMPEPGAQEVRVNITAAGINPVDTYNLKDPSWAGISTPCILGYDIAGTVDAVGAGVDPAFVGKRVLAMTSFPAGQGGYAEYTVVRSDLVAVLNDDADLVAAASIPLAAGTAWEVLQKLQGAGDRMLVLGASGGVGLFLLQLAAAAGIKVVGVGSERNHSVMRDFGAVGCVDYHSANYLTDAAHMLGGSFDSIADLLGGPTVVSAQPYLRHDGSICAIATPELDLDQVIDANQVFYGVLIRDDGQRTRHLAKLFDTGQLRTHVTHVLPLEELAEAHRLVDSGHAGGKVVLTT